MADTKTFVIFNPATGEIENVRKCEPLEVMDGIEAPGRLWREVPEGVTADTHQMVKVRSRWQVIQRAEPLSSKPFQMKSKIR